MGTVSEIFEQIVGKFNASAAAGMDVIFQFNISDDDHYYLVVANESCELHQGDHEDPSVTLILSKETLEKIISGKTSGMQAFMLGKLKTEGNMMLATKLGDLFSM
ncbi:SCP2 sterol-binding domain-containing protein [Gynuella sp.]|uniref:SCP2 sterol-binding domain-containing protein n=1 Tax=Gynuella sp. TaxID=2969146 RepID=UPI003D0E5206